MIQDLYERHFEELRRYCLQLSRSGDVAFDLVQETFLKALEREELLLSLSPEQQRAWLYKAARNLFLDGVRRSALLQRKQNLLLDEEEQMESGFSRTETELLLLRLPAEDRTLFRLRYLEGYSAVELAEMFDMPPATVRTRLLRARLSLKKEMSL
jgi:RNA polymerase sigma-70 factor (ECF subfamily)